MPERLADFIIVIGIDPGAFKPFPGILDGIGGKLER